MKEPLKLPERIPYSLRLISSKQQEIVAFGIYDSFSGKRLQIDVESKTADQARDRAARFKKRVVILAYTKEIKNIGSVESI